MYIQGQILRHFFATISQVSIAHLDSYLYYLTPDLIAYKVNINVPIRHRT